MPNATHHDADIVLRLYDIRREEVMRRARKFVGFEFWPRWFSTPQLKHVRLFGGLYIIGLFADNLLRIFLPTFWR